VTEGVGVVANPGARPELPMMAAGLAAAGTLRTYVAPFATTASETVRAPRVLPPRLRRRAARELARRSVPGLIQRGHMLRRSTLLEAISVIASRHPITHRAAEPLRHLRNYSFDRNVARALKGSDRLFIGDYGASAQAMRRCAKLGITSFLNAPIAHYRFARQILEEEACLVPTFASTLPVTPFRDWYEQALEREFALADYIIVPSRFAARTFIEFGVSSDRLVVVPLGVDTDLFTPRKRSGRDVFRILFVGQLTQQKGLSYLFSAFREAALGAAELLVVGRPLGNAIELARNAGARTVAHVPRAFLPNLYNAADVCVLPSLFEGFGLTALEAMACGVPTIVSANTFASDVITDAYDGFIVPIRDVTTLAERLMWLKNNDDARHEIGAAARGTAERLSWLDYGGRLAHEVLHRSDGSGVW
jgi:alpha-maltose-1-phosphate synthase